ncbi:hypothetical protein LTR70_009428 [Exophiala xenobiotica]|uniref:DUF1223-domain-containing protein n=1 Tax=Lithohypha guttulata TaxID=1690604 RepID=A0ABR0JXG2_9EURO|nr:hypothetical protein LTR24_009290 [Lithohypha guttulata]KAK5310503.1 hypothetical protein LTR70_009428 [Exophiala xenobiotica]
MSSVNPIRRLLTCCSSDGQYEDHAQPRLRIATQHTRGSRWNTAPAMDVSTGSDLPSPPPYSVFDPHPADCQCAIHVHKQHPIRPTVVEAFQSQGCSSCPPTNTYLLSLLTQADPNILVLDYHVTTWDHLGWQDTFSLKAADDYQREYARARGTTRVYTPQVVVNGVAEGTGNSKGKLEQLIKDASLTASAGWPWLLFSKVDEGVLIREASAATAATRRTGRVIEVVYDPTLREVETQSGENVGKVLPYRNVVKSLEIIGDWMGDEEVVPVQPRNLDDRTERVLIVQQGIGGVIIGVARI